MAVRKLNLKESEKGSLKSLINAVQNKIDEIEEETYGESLEESVGPVSGTDISHEDQLDILDIFDQYDVVILRTDVNTEVFNGVMYKNFVVETDVMSREAFVGVERALNQLEDTHNIGFEKNSSGNGLYAYVYYFYPFNV